MLIAYLSIFLFIYFLCCKYRPFFPIFFYIIPTKICKILFFSESPFFLPFSFLFPSLSFSFLPLSFSLSSLPLFSLFRPLYPGSWVRCSSAASLSLPFPSYKQKACRHHPHSDAPTGFSHTFISGIAIVILFLYFNHFFTSS